MPNHRLDRMSMLMQLLPVILAQQREGQQNALGYANLGRETSHDQGQNALAQLGLTQQGDWHQAEIANQQAQLAELAKYHQGELSHQDAIVQAQRESDSNRMNMDFMSHLMSNPNVSLEKALPALAALDPRFAKVGQVMHQGAIDSAVAAQTPAVQGMYDLYNKGHDYGQLQKGLAALQTATPNQEVFNALPWDRLNQGMYQAPPPEPSAMAPQVGTGVGAMLGHIIRNAPGAIATGLQQADTSMTDMGSNFWANLFGLSPETDTTPKPVRPWGPFSK